VEGRKWRNVLGGEIKVEGRKGVGKIKRVQEEHGGRKGGGGIGAKKVEKKRKWRYKRVENTTRGERK
jgi:hypothetical protein